MKTRIRSFALTVFGAAVIASGVFRFAFFEGGEKGLSFGLVMGGLALFGSWLAARGRLLPGLMIGAAAMAFVAGWFAYECFVIKGVATADRRQLIVLAVTIVTASIVARPGLVMRR